MKNTLLKCFYAVLLLGCSFSAGAQNITIDSLLDPPDSACMGPWFFIQTSAYVPGLTVKTYYGDGTSDINPVVNGGSFGYASYNHAYKSAGTFTTKTVLYNGVSKLDSSIRKRKYMFCNTFNVQFFRDIDANCLYDSATEKFVQQQFVIQVSKAGIPVDTITALSGIHYTVVGAAGTVYAFRILSAPAGLNIACPSTGIIYDTIQPMANGHIVKYFATTCAGVSGTDVSIKGTTRAGRHTYLSEYMVSNAFCTPQTVTVTMYKSPKYTNVGNIKPTPTSIVGNKLTWTLTGVSIITPVLISVHYEQSPWLIPGDTVQTRFSIAPPTGDTDTTNNNVIRTDTVSGSFDPNDKAVMPQGIISSGTRLTYTLRFENMGNDTAFNVHILDTLSSDLDVSTLDVIASSATMNLGLMQYGSQYIAKFDFPDINLLDSSKKGFNSGFVMFSIKTKPGLANGTIIGNRGGIYFDYNDVVLTNTVYSTIGIPTETMALSNMQQLAVYPNPVRDVLIVETGNNVSGSVSISNLVGQVLITQQLASAKAAINVMSLPAGIYILTIKNESGVRTQKFEKL
ncbi:MAG: hypothetical protein K0Q79_399 [Flavipsychrobacter sp.]|jgi:uncharacterized repeat protein (TIGR01451 family)|nr:hypothetical protein [Flavipsychrobacter sp.]